eukprot:319160_1
MRSPIPTKKNNNKKSPNKNDKKQSPQKNDKTKSSKKNTTKKSRKKTKVATKKEKKISIIILKQAYNKIVSVFASPTIEKSLKEHMDFELLQTQNEETNKSFSKAVIEEEEEKEMDSQLLIVKTGKRINRDIQAVIKMLELPESAPSKDNDPNTMSMYKVHILLDNKFNNCIKQNDMDLKWYCQNICYVYVEDGDMSRYNAGKEDAFALTGATRFRPRVALKHCNGGLHRHCLERKMVKENKKKGNINVAIEKMSAGAEEILMRDCVIVYGDYKRGTISANCFVLQRTVSSTVDWYINLPSNKYEPWDPKLEDIQYGNQQRHDRIRSYIAAEIVRRLVKKPIEEAGGINHLIDGWDHKGEKYNNFVNISMPNGQTKTIWLGLVEPTGYGAAGETEAMLQSYTMNNIDHTKVRADSITFDGPNQHIGSKKGVGVRYIKDCTEKGFKFIPVLNICCGHKTQNLKKDVFNKDRTSKSVFYYEIDKDILCYVEIDNDLKQLVQEMNKSNYSSQFKDWA